MRFVACTIVMLVSLSSAEGAQTRPAKRAIDRLISKLKRLRRGENVPIPRVKPFRTRLNDLLRPGRIDEGVPVIRKLKESGQLTPALRSILRSDPREGIRILRQYGAEAPALLRKLGSDGLVLNRYLGKDRLLKTLRKIEQGWPALRSGLRTAQDVQHGKGLVHVVRIMGGGGLRFVGKHWKLLALAGVLTLLYTHPEMLADLTEEIARGARAIPEAAARGFFHNDDGSPNEIAILLVVLAGLSALALLSNFVYRMAKAYRAVRGGAALSPGSVSKRILGLLMIVGVGGGATWTTHFILEKSRRTDTGRHQNQEKLLSERRDREIGRRDALHRRAEALFLEAQKTRSRTDEMILRAAAGRREFDTRTSSLQDRLRENRRDVFAKNASLALSAEALAVSRLSYDSLARNQGRADLSDTEDLIQQAGRIRERAAVIGLEEPRSKGGRLP